MVFQDINKINKVIMLTLVWGSMGFYLEIPGPTMIDIKIIFSATYEEVSRSVSGRGAGGFFGALIGGFLVDKFSNSLDLLIALSETIAGLAIILVPYTYTINTLWFHYLILGMCNSIVGIAGVRSVIILWPQNTAVTLQLLHVGYGIGALLVPLVVNPFLAVVQFPKQIIPNKNSEDFNVIKETRVHIVYIAIGIGTILLSLVFYRFHFDRYFCKGYKRVKTSPETSSKKLTFKEMINPATYSNGQFCYGVYILTVLFLYYFTLVGGMEMFGQFVRSFSVTVFRFSKSEASYLNMTFWLGLTIGRLVGSVLSSYVPIRKLFLFQVFMHLMSSSMLNMYASLRPSLLWYCTAFEGFLISPLYPSGIAYTNTFFEVSGLCLMIIRLGGSFGDLSFIWISGTLYDLYGPNSILYTIQLVGMILIFCAVFLRIGEKCICKTVKELELLINP
ncbi:sodium-dependent glucose transporter 1-like isoform X1 [Ruditapes philippinarum]|uniref:sodium-dependent glucose transporter 1-like isoform X1 n=1 Tax=Ruditapes philippinarum TaxID=129788 RepID=UPI00295C2463|nr:sodium-dependent glucose transporter 1-like isoform X1 [Ruditapes philippinarum]